VSLKYTIPNPIPNPALAAHVSERGTASGVGCHGLTTEANACHFTWKDINTLHVTH